MPDPILIITGPPGVGKTTAALMIADRFDPSAVVAGDHFFEYLQRGKIPPWEPESNDQNTRIIDITLQTALSYADGGWTTVLEGIIGPWFSAQIKRTVDGADVSYAVLGAPVQTCIERVAARAKGPSTEVVEKMHSEFERAEVELRHRVDATADPTELAGQLVDGMISGALRL